MQVIGPNWESTEALRAALADVQSEKVFKYGAQNHMDGPSQLHAFKAAGILSPDWTPNLDAAKSWVRQGVEVWGRKRVHTQGTDIVGAGYCEAQPGGRVLKWIFDFIL